MTETAADLRPYIEKATWIDPRTQALVLMHGKGQGPIRALCEGGFLRGLNAWL